MAATAALKVTPDMLGAEEIDTYDGPIEIDAGNLLAYDPSPVDPAAFRADKDAACLDLTTRMCQSLFRTLFTLPSESANPDPGRIAHLPTPTTRIPREKPLPKPRPPTKWEQFAQRKGIQKRKRSKLVFDETTEEWKRRYGYKKADDPNDVPIIDAKPGDERGFDPFLEMQREKKERVKKNKQQQLANLKNAAKVAGKGALPPTIALTAKMETTSTGKKEKRKDLKNEIKSASLASGVSTASMGKFDKLLKGEKPEERRLLRNRNKRMPVTDKTGTEKKSMSNIVGRIVRERADDIFDDSKAVRGVERERRNKAAQQNLAKVKGGVEKKERRVSRNQARGGKAKREKGAKPSKMYRKAKK